MHMTRREVTTNLDPQIIPVRDHQNRVHQRPQLLARSGGIVPRERRGGFADLMVIHFCQVRE